MSSHSLSEYDLAHASETTIVSHRLQAPSIQYGRPGKGALPASVNHTDETLVGEKVTCASVWIGLKIHSTATDFSFNT